MAITLFGSVSVPVDGASATNTADPTAFANPPIASMVTGDLVIVYAWCRTASATLAVSNAGGQTWTSGTSRNAANTTLSANFFWCRYNGTWSAAPSFSFGATTNNCVWMLVFRPSASTNFWGVDAAKTGVYTDEAAAASFTITGWTPAHASNVSLTFANTADDNTWTLSGTNWSKTSLAAQVRNTSGLDTSAQAAYQIQSAAAATNNAVHTEASLGNDAGITFAICFYEYTINELSGIYRDIEQPYFGRFLLASSGIRMRRLPPAVGLLIGDTSTGNIDLGVTDGFLILQKFTASASGNMTEFRLVAGSAADFMVCIYSDNAGSPDVLLNSTSSAACSVGANTITFPSTAIVSGTSYWLGYNMNLFDAIAVNSAAGGTILYKALTYGNAFPNPAGAGFTSGTWQNDIAGWGF